MSNGGRCHVQHVACRRAPWPESPGPGRHAPPLGSGARERLLFGPGGRRCCGGRASRPHPWRSKPAAGSGCNAAAQPHGRNRAWRRGGKHNVHNVATSPIRPPLVPHYVPHYRALHGNGLGLKCSRRRLSTDVCRLPICLTRFTTRYGLQSVRNCCTESLGV